MSKTKEKIDNLVTVDPVGQQSFGGHNKRPANLKNWINIEAMPPENKANLSDAIARIGNLGRRKSRLPTEQADKNKRLPFTHQDFFKMMMKENVNETLDKAYEDQDKDSSESNDQNDQGETKP